MAIFEGAGVAVVTPFKENGEVNYEKLAELVDYQIEHGTDSIIICGTTGEASTLSFEEHFECIQVAVDTAKHRVPVIAGTGSNCTETAISLSREAEKRGVEGILSVTPYYNKATQNGLIGHFTDIARAIDIPIILYHIPGRTGCTMQPQTIATLAKKVDNIVGVKEASGDMSQIAKMMYLAEGEIDLYSGNDDQILPLMALGAKGVISVISNIAPQQTHDIVASYLKGDVKESLELQLKAIPLMNALFSEVNPIPIKKAMNLMGFETGPLRKPLTDMEKEHVTVLVKAMEQYGLRLAH